MRLDDKRAIVAGVGGIGAEVALQLAREGALVWSLDSDAEKVESVTRAIKAEGGIAGGICCDSTQYSQLEDSIGSAVQMMGGLDTFVTTVGGGSVSVPFLDVDLSVWREVLERNLTAVFMSAQLAARHMAARKKGSLVLTSSQLGQVARAGQAPYCSAKGGVNQLVKVIATDLAPYNIRANALAPGPTWTAAAERALAEEGMNIDAVQRIQSLIPLGRWGSPNEIAHAAVFLASDESSFITGTTLVVDGGYTSV